MAWSGRAPPDPPQLQRKTLILSAETPGDTAHAARIILSGGIVAFPTETVYGLGGLALQPASVQRIFDAKERPATNPLILHITSAEAALPLWRITNAAEDRAAARAMALATKFWPGPVTIVNYKSSLVPDLVTAGLDRVAARTPAHPTALELLTLIGEPVAAPSANLSSRVSPTNAGDVIATLNFRIDAVLDGGDCAIGIESTVVDVTTDPPCILRAGAVSREAIQAVLPDVEYLECHGRVPNDGGPAPSPGMSLVHYAPRIDRVRIAKPQEIVRAWMSPDGLLIFTDTAEQLRRSRGGRPPSAPTVELPRDPTHYSKELYSSLYRLERAAPAALWIEEPPRTSGWIAVRDRLIRASAAGPVAPG